MAAPLTADHPLPVTKKQRELQIGVEPPGPAMKTPVPGPQSLRLKQELDEIQVWDPTVVILDQAIGL